jgi:DNA-binding beta-propeller fold protein YncE
MGCAYYLTMRPARVLSVAAAAIIAAGTTWTAGPAFSATQRPVRPAGPASAARPASPRAAVSLPPCTTAVASASPLNLETSMVSVSGNPFGVATTSDGEYAFVATTSNPSSLLVFSTSAFTPTLVRTIALTGSPTGVALSPNGQYLLIASDSGAIVVDVAAAETGTSNPVVGTLTSGGTEAIQVAFSKDGDYAFVTLEDSGEAAVFDFAAALASGFATSGLVGYIPLNEAPVGMALSPDGAYLYVTSEEISGDGEEGSLSVIDVATAETDPADSVVNTVDAGCNPVRVIASADGKYVWVTARASDALLVFSASALQSGAAASPLITWIQVREAPVDLAFVGQGQYIVVADSDRFDVEGASPDLAVVNVADVLSGQPALTGIVTSGVFPRELSLEANGNTLLATNFGNTAPPYDTTLEAVDVGGLPVISNQNVALRR